MNRNVFEFDIKYWNYNNRAVMDPGEERAEFFFKLNQMLLYSDYYFEVCTFLLSLTLKLVNEPN